MSLLELLKTLNYLDWLHGTDLKNECLNAFRYTGLSEQQIDFRHNLVTQTVYQDDYLSASVVVGSDCTAFVIDFHSRTRVIDAINQELDIICSLI
ncbi:TPA: hypothetical protein MBF00_000610 [Klebsiella aerogenes]|nr:hypothetical protein [Klebsiella aerogenes]